jgi:molybdopterin/thiamine biosynthesis adenylyltransferase
VTFNDHLAPPPGFRKELLRTESAWGRKVQQDLSRLHVGIVGLGSVGSIIAETLARMGVSRVSLIDFDSVKTHNLDRILHSSRWDALTEKAKVHVLAKALKNSATAEGFNVLPLELSVIEEAGHRAALDCDVVFSCVDRPYPRAALNLIAYAHLIPVIDGGISARSNRTNTGIKSADWRSHIAGPGHKCLECLGQFTPDLAALDREGFLDDPKYIEGLPPSHETRHNENVFAFSLSVAAMEVQHFIKLVVPDFGPPSLGARHYHHVTGIMDGDTSACNATCLYTGLTAKGDSAGISFTGRHRVAEQARLERHHFISMKIKEWWRKPKSK